MSFLPIVERELRVAARRRTTFRVRWWAALLALGLTLLSALVMAASRAGSAGNSVFGLLTGYAFGLSLLAGTVLTADALTEEKRAGTLGLLFLTNLKGYDVVLGKFIAHSLNAFYCLLALLPITALPLLLGGVEGAEFWRTALALANALFFSLASGVCLSAFMRDSQRAMANTLGLVLLAAVCLPLIGQLANIPRVPSLVRLVPWFSPFYPFSYASEILYARHANVYWGSLGCSQLLGWCFLGLASFLLPRGLRVQRVSRRRAAHARTSRSARRGQWRARLLDRNPVQWLRADDLRIPWLAWFLSTAWVATAFAVSLLGSADTAVMLGYISAPFGFLLKTLFAVQICKFFVDARAHGSMELLLCTPLTDQQIIWGQIRAVWAAFAGPIVLFVVGLFAPALLKIFLLLSSAKFEPMFGVLGGTLLSGVQVLRLAADLFAVQWVGLALALTGKRPRLAPAFTILWVLVAPSPFFYMCWLDILIDVIFIAWGSSKCRLSLRRLAAEQYQAPSV